MSGQLNDEIEEEDELGLDEEDDEVEEDLEVRAFRHYHDAIWEDNEIEVNMRINDRRLNRIQKLRSTSRTKFGRATSDATSNDAVAILG